jgi:hypothetical protein
MWWKSSIGNNFFNAGIAMSVWDRLKIGKNNVGTGTLKCMPYINYNNNRNNYGKFRPFGNGIKKPVKSFRDLEVYQKTIECSVLIDRDIMPALEKVNSKMAEDLSKNALNIPLYISEGHSLRFADFALALGYLEKALSGCNKVSVYLDHIKGQYGDAVKGDLVEDLINRYFIARQKIFRLELSWKKFQNNNINTLPPSR